MNGIIRESDDDNVDAGDISGMTADEYLAWVRYQAENMPEVSKAEVIKDVLVVIVKLVIFI